MEKNFVKKAGKSWTIPQRMVVTTVPQIATEDR